MLGLTGRFSGQMCKRFKTRYIYAIKFSIIPFDFSSVLIILDIMSLFVRRTMLLGYVIKMHTHVADKSALHSPFSSFMK